MQPATAETVLGDFNDAAITHFGVTSRFFTRGGRFYVNTEGPDGALADFELTYTFGAEPLQQYLSPFPGGRLQSLTIAWDSVRGAWFPLYPDARTPPGDPLHWTGRSQNWNGMCAECHSTNLRKHYDPDTDTYRTRWDEIDVGCQACHGPGAAHVAWARARPGDDPAGARADGLVVDLDAAPARTEIETCAGCHSRRQRLDDGTQAGQPFLDGFRPSALGEGLYHADGQIQGEVYVWGSYVQSRMYAAGVRCSHCHDPHSLEVPAGDNAVCVQCHSEAPAPAFPTPPAKRYDTPLHPFHDEGSEGALCVNCHMPAQTYMIVDPRRDHSFRIPRPDVSARHGTPNACTNCHADRDAAWAAAQAAAWWGAPENPAHFADVIAAARRGDRGAAPQLLALLEDTGNAAIVRATALDLLVPEGAGAGDAIAAATADPDPLVRTAAAAALDRLPQQPRIAAAGPLLEDPARTVRIEAARVLASVDPAALGGRQDHQSRAFSEYVAAQLVSADMPAARLNLGIVAPPRGPSPAGGARVRSRAGTRPQLPAVAVQSRQPVQPVGAQRRGGSRIARRTPVGTGRGRTALLAGPRAGGRTPPGGRSDPLAARRRTDRAPAGPVQLRPSPGAAGATRRGGDGATRRARGE